MLDLLLLELKKINFYMKVKISYISHLIYFFFMKANYFFIRALFFKNFLTF